MNRTKLVTIIQEHRPEKTAGFQHGILGLDRSVTCDSR